MSENFNFLFLYLEKESISCNRSEFEFQIKSHPDYPSLLAISETLSFFNIDNGAIPVDTTDLELLPDRFVALLKEDNNNPVLYFIEKINDSYLCIKNEIVKEISKLEIEARWNNIVLLVEKSDEVIVKSNHNKWLKWMPFLSLLLFVLAVIKSETSVQSKLFFIFPSLGILFSIAVLKDLFGNNSSLINKFCNITKTTSCSSVVSSKKWKIFELVDFSDLSMFFFGSQFIGLMLFMFASDTIAFFSIQKVLLVGSLPIILLSLYYQKFIEKKWCPICLIIITTVLFEIIYLAVFTENMYDISIESTVRFVFIFVLIITIWSMLKKILNQRKELQDFWFKGNRFMRNYEVFKNTLIASDPIQHDEIQSDSLLIGNPDAPLKITIVTSPFCSFCVEAHNIIEEVLMMHSETVYFDVRFNFNETNSDEKSKKIHQTLLAIYYQEGANSFMKSLHEWFYEKDENKLINFKIDNSQILKIDTALNEQFKWNQKNDLNYTPVIMINEYIFPKQYDRKELIHFITDLSEDEDFNII